MNKSDKQPVQQNRDGISRRVDTENMSKPTDTLALDYGNRFATKQIYKNASEVFKKNLTIEEVKNDCVIILDTNVLLVPYQTGKQSLGEIQKTYQKLAEENRLIIPGQVAREFARNRPEKLKELYQQLSNKRIQLRTGNYPLLESLQEYKEALKIESELQDLLKKYTKSIDKIMEEVISWEGNDPVTLLYNNVGFGDLVIDPTFDEKFLNEDALRRKHFSLPPGYKDFTKEDNPLGDLIIWHTILEVAQLKKQNIIFVSGDNKSDWWHKSNTKTLLPRFELVDEFRHRSEGKSFHIIPLSQLLDLYGANKEVVQEVKVEERQILESQKNVANPNINMGLRFSLTVADWLRKQHYFRQFKEHDLSFPDFLMENNTGNIVGVEVEYIQSLAEVRNKLEEVYAKSVHFGQKYNIYNNIYKSLLLVLIFANEEEAKIGGNNIKTSYFENIEFISGWYDFGTNEFVAI